MNELSVHATSKVWSLALTLATWALTLTLTLILTLTLTLTLTLILTLTLTLTVRFVHAFYIRLRLGFKASVGVRIEIMVRFVHPHLKGVELGDEFRHVGDDPHPDPDSDSDSDSDPDPHLKGVELGDDFRHVGADAGVGKVGCGEGPVPLQPLLHPPVRKPAQIPRPLQGWGRGKGGGMRETDRHTGA